MKRWEQTCVLFYQGNSPFEINSMYLQDLIISVYIFLHFKAIRFFFQCKELGDGKYQSKVLEEGTSKDFGSQDKSFPEGTFWINLVRSSQQTFL